MSKIDEHRNFVTTSLVKITTDIEHIKEKTAKVEQHLEVLNGRVRKNENMISWIRGIGVTFAFIVSTIIGFFMKE
jgi:hypothetical protein